MKRVPPAMLGPRQRFRCAATVILLGMSGCTPRSPGSSQPRARDDITRSELGQVPSESAYGAIAQLRPSWLFHRRTPTPTNLRPEPAVYLDRARLRELDDLYTIPVEDIERIQFLTARDATTRFGTGHMWGAIVVITRTPGT